MARSSAAIRRLDEARHRLNRQRPSFGGGEPPAPPVRPITPIVSNARLAMMMFIGAEAMFFAGLIGAFLVFRLASSMWPPPFQPRLPVGVTGVNTAILVLSAFTMHLSLRSIRVGLRVRMIRLLGLTAALGAIFLAIQGYEWVRLIQFGLTVSSSVYGGLFYTLIGFHGIHVLGAMVWLLVLFFQTKQERFSRKSHARLQLCSMYWTFVVGLWPMLYGLVYLY
jgi:cytochrome c oxidase subunit 3